MHSASGSKFGEEYSELKAASFFLLLLLVMLWLPLNSLWSCFLHLFESTAVWSGGWGAPEAGAAFLGLSPLPPEWILSSPLCLTAVIPSLWQEAGRVSRNKENCFLMKEPLRETQMPPFLEPWIKAPLMVSTSTPGSESLPAWAALYFHQAPFRKKNILTQRTL